MILLLRGIRANLQRQKLEAGSQIDGYGASVYTSKMVNSCEYNILRVLIHVVLHP